LLKLTTGVNFINVLHAAFAPVDPKSVKRYWQLDWILMFLGATGIKAAHKYVVEIDYRSLANWENVAATNAVSRHLDTIINTFI